MIDVEVLCRILFQRNGSQAPAEMLNALKKNKKNPNQFVFQARVLATIGVTRGLGDHDLKVHDSNIFIKPFLSCCPEVK